MLGLFGPTVSRIGREDSTGHRSEVMIVRPTAFGNPFVVGTYSKAEAIRLYALHFDEYVVANKKLAAAFQELRTRLASGESLKLVCVCRTGTSCHGDVIVRRLLQTVNTQ